VSASTDLIWRYINGNKLLLSLMYLLSEPKHTLHAIQANKQLSLLSHLLTTLRQSHCHCATKQFGIGKPLNRIIGKTVIDELITIHHILEVRSESDVQILSQTWV